MNPKFIQCTSQDGDYVFINLTTEQLHWFIPELSSFIDVAYIAHQSDVDKYYYEFLRDGSVTWQLPGEVEEQPVSPNIAQVIVSLAYMTRDAISRQSGEDFEEEAIYEQRDLFIDFLDHLDDPRYSKRISMSQLCQFGLQAYDQVIPNTDVVSTATSSSLTVTATKIPSNSSIGTRKSKEKAEEEYELPAQLLQKTDQGMELTVIKVSSIILNFPLKIHTQQSLITIERNFVETCFSVYGGLAKAVRGTYCGCTYVLSSRK